MYRQRNILNNPVMVGLTVCSMKYLPVRGFVIFILTSHSCDPKREINFKRRKKKSFKAVFTCETWYIYNKIAWTFYFKKRRVWQSGLCNLNTCEHKGSNVDLDFPSAASVSRSVQFRWRRKHEYCWSIPRSCSCFSGYREKHHYYSRYGPRFGRS